MKESKTHSLTYEGTNDEGIDYYRCIHCRQVFGVRSLGEMVRWEKRKCKGEKVK